MCDMEDKENETQPDNVRSNKLVAEPSGRRLVLKEVDTFLPSPSPLKQKQKNSDVLILDEEEIFVDAETSLTSYVCPRNKNIEINSEKETRESWRDNQEEPVILNDTAEMSYVKVEENLSHVDEALSVDKTSSEEDFEFNFKKHSKDLDIVHSNSENNVLNITKDVDLKTGLNGNIMVDSLENTFDNNSIQLDSSIGTVMLNKTGPIEVQENAMRMVVSPEPQLNTEPLVNKENLQNIEYSGCGSMVDSLERPQESALILDTTFEKNQENLVDSLEIVDAEDNIQPLYTQETSLIIEMQNIKDKAQVYTPVNKNDVCTNTANLNKTFEAPSTIGKPEASLSLTNSIDAAIKNQKPPELDRTFEEESGIVVENFNKTITPQFENPSVNVDICTSFERPASGPIESQTEQVQNDQGNTLNGNLDLDITFEGSSSVLIQPKTDQVVCDKINVPNRELLKSFVTNSSDTVEIKNVQVYSDQMNTSNSNVHLNKTFEGPILDSVQPKTDQINTSIVENRTSEAPTFNIVKLKTDEIQSDASNRSLALEEASKTIDLQAVEKDVITDSKITDNIFDSDESKPIIEQNSNPTEKFVNQDEGDPKENKIKSNMGQKDEYNSENLPVDKLLGNPLNSTVTLNAENLGYKIIVGNTELGETSSEVAGKVEDNIDEEATKLELSHSKFPTTDASIIQAHSVSLKEIIGIDIPLEAELQQNEIEQTCSIPSFAPSSLENANSTFITDEKAAESSRVMEALAQSLNQTIDVEESAIADDVNSSRSTNTSGDLSKEVFNDTLENIKEGSSTSEPVVIVKPLKSDERTEERRNNKTLERKETEEFEDLEKQYETTETTDKCAKEAIDSLEAVIDKFGEDKVDTGVEEQYSRTFLRQDTREFEVLERECDQNNQNINDYGARNINSSEEVVKSNDDVKEEDINIEENIKDKKESKLVKRQETQEFEDLERECTEKVELPKEYSNESSLNETIQKSNLAVKGKENDTQNASTTATSKVVKEEVVVENTDLPVKPNQEQIKVRVSGNICHVNSKTEEIDQLDSRSQINQPFTGINLKYDLIKQNSKSESVNTTTHNDSDVKINGHNEVTSKTTDKLTEEVPNSIDAKSDKVPQLSENIQPTETITKPKNMPECRPSTRSLRNKTQVIDKPVINDDASKEIPQNIGVNSSNFISTELAEKQVHEYKTKTEQLKTEMEKLQTEIVTVKEENRRKDKYILTCALDIEAERDNVVEYRKLVEEFEKTIARQAKDLKHLKEEEEKKSMRFTSLEMAFADLFEKYEKAKSIIGQYRKNEETLQRNIQGAEDQLTKLEAKCSFTKDQYSVKLKKVEEQMIQEKDKYRQDIAKLQAMVKRLEIKSSSLETALQQKTEECRALSALCDDITGKPI